MSEEKSMTAEGLAACPFCGGKAGPVGSRWVGCNNRDHLGGVCPGAAFVCEPHVWNTRPVDPRIAELEAALKKSREYIQTVECWHDGKADQLPIKAEHDLDLDCDCDQCVLLTIIDALIGKEGK